MCLVVDESALLHLPHHAGNARVRVLNVVHGVVVGARGRELQIEIQVLVVAAHDVEQARGIVAHFLAQVAQRDELPRARRHLRLLAAAEQGNELHQAHFEGLLGSAQRHQARRADG